MEDLIGYQSSVIIVTGLTIDAFGALVLILFSGRALRFILSMMNRSVSDNFQKETDDKIKKEKSATRGGLLCLIIGFAIQVIGHMWPFIRS